MTFNDMSKMLPDGWRQALQMECEKPYWRQLEQFLQRERAAGEVIFPPANNIFQAFKAVSFDAVKVVILGQDPYHGDAQAHGLSFSVPQGIAIPPSLKNIYKEVAENFSADMSVSGCLQPWTAQGVLLLNSTLTVARGRAGSHQGKGWEIFTDAVIALLNREREGIVFMLWGAYAHKKGHLLDETRHCVLRSVHPSPLSAYRGFLGCQHFLEANRYLQARGCEEINWV